MAKHIAPTFLWMDYETYGSRPGAVGLDSMATQQPTQFAWCRTSMDLTEVLDQGVISCKPAPNHVPLPITVNLTALSPKALHRDGVSEWEFCRTITALLDVPKTCVVGFNSMGFDHTITRYLLYRNMFPYYSWQYTAENSLWDVIDLFRCAEALRPEGFSWPTNSDGLLSMKQEHLAAANNCLMGTAHDALGDVQTLLALCRKIKSSHQKLWTHLFNIRSKNSVLRELKKWREPAKAFVLIAGRIGRKTHHCSVVIELGVGAKGQHICVDLCKPLEQWAELSTDELREALFTSGTHARPPLRTFKANQCPVVLPLGILTEENWTRLNFCRAEIERRQQFLRESPDLKQRLMAVFNEGYSTQELDVGSQMYSGMLSSLTKSELADFRSMVTAESARVQDFSDSRYKELSLRFLGKNFPTRLNPRQQAQWHQHCVDRIRTDLPRCQNELSQMLARGEWTAPLSVLEDLKAHYKELEKCIGHSTVLPVNSNESDSQ